MAAVFVDREDSLEVLGTVARRLGEGSGNVLILEGDSGMGKSSLLNEFSRRAGDDEACRVVLVSCLPGFGTGRQYGPFLDALDELSASPRGGRRRARWAQAMGRGAMAAAPAVLSLVVPGMGELLTAGRAAAEATVATGTIPGDSLGPLQSTLTRQLIEVLLAEARDGAPLLLLIDDIQLCDEASLELLHLLLPKLDGEPLGLILSLGSYSSTTVGGAAVEQALAMWEARHNLLVARHTVPPLPDWAVGELVRARLSDRDVPAGFADQVFSATKGRPVFVDQCLKLWHPGYGSKVPLPEELPAAISERLARIDPEARELLVLGATVGEYFFSHTLAEVTGLAQTRVQDLLHRVEREHGLVCERRRADMPRWARNLYIDWYDFDHRALQFCIRNDQQTEGARMLRHARIADALPQLPRADDALPREIRAMIAYQLQQAGPACAAASASAHYELARSVALDELAFAQAEKYCRVAIDSARQLPKGNPDRDRRLVEAAELLLSLTEVRWRGYATESDSGIDALAAEAEEAARRLGDQLLSARTTLMRGKTLLAVRGLDPALEKLGEAVTPSGSVGLTARRPSSSPWLNTAVTFPSSTSTRACRCCMKPRSCTRQTHGSATWPTLCCSTPGI
ncbi:AAA family ATPase [Streptomyces sp. AS02]|uniref:AAA family ATPase n=1 Tax=Streptomyces sp. AS02 TaxID=2938946 RepID=UPI0020214A92|nr:AAA family ATPase [Streptomyces sp. AS02]MCL8011390.1 AAA family ATPase [Streptomyces sp. AS02]